MRHEGRTQFAVCVNGWGRAIIRVRATGVSHQRMPVTYDLGSAQFEDEVRVAGHKAFAETPDAGAASFRW